MKEPIDGLLSKSQYIQGNLKKAIIPCVEIICLQFIIHVLVHNEIKSWILSLWIFDIVCEMLINEWFLKEVFFSLVFQAATVEGKKDYGMQQNQEICPT